MPTVLLTGATGFLGSHLLGELRRRNYHVRALVRTATTHLPADARTALITGDMTDPVAVKQAMDGCDAVIHAAALAQANPARNPALWTANLTGTETLLEAARHVPLTRFVYVGTANSFGFGTRDQPGDETRPYVGHRYGSDYMDSKRAAMERVEQAVRHWNLPAVLVHPTFMLGPHDRKPTSGQMLLELHRGRVIGYPAGGKNYVHVQDVAVATVNALTQGRMGESYILGNQNLSYQEAFALMARTMEVPPPRWPIPPVLAQLYGRGCDAWTRLSGRPALVNAAMVAVANDGHYFSSQKAIRELGLPQTPIEQAVAEAYQWFKQNGYVDKRT
ncbi:NAD-dependent epimerase/dehydratase family protein [Spirosoma montaniterrae]|uniref:Dihydroflavonol 4-reductase n=1 Tax=Spirosoma montaniterrae TaxID=1178516 RepID=A0A1P9X081_9BACT|nr:NAD-dependent epimerase/dehydratase family protein [Spirosoma montaniterrae]AQG80993.1 dihydroflavonol 4-reductase [Spirosoma montaniterrae]